MDIPIGSVVYSENGRNKGYFVVVKTEKDFVFLADGKSRTIDNPKKKKAKHIKTTGVKSEIIAERISLNLKVGKETLKKVLKPFK